MKKYVISFTFMLLAALSMTGCKSDLEKAVEKMESAHAEFEEASDKIESLEAEIEKNNQRIKEILRE